MNSQVLVFIYEKYLNNNRIKSTISYYFYFLPVSYGLYAQPDSKVRYDVIVQRITKDKLEIFAITKHAIISFLAVTRL